MKSDNWEKVDDAMEFEAREMVDRRLMVDFEAKAVVLKEMKMEANRMSWTT